MLNRKHLYLSESEHYVQPGEHYIQFKQVNHIIDLWSNIVIILLMGMITIILVSFLLSHPINVDKKQK